MIRLKFISKTSHISISILIRLKVSNAAQFISWIMNNSIRTSATSITFKNTSEISISSVLLLFHKKNTINSSILTSILRISTSAITMKNLSLSIRKTIGSSSSVITPATDIKPIRDLTRFKLLSLTRVDTKVSKLHHSSSSTDLNQ